MIGLKYPELYEEDDIIIMASKPCSEYTVWSGAAGGGVRLGAPPLDLLPDLSDHFDHGGAIMIAIE